MKEHRGAVQPVPDLVAPIWERQPGEAPSAYELFRIYRSLPITDRSIAEAARRYANGTGRASTYAKVNNVKWRWEDRARAHDAWVESIRRDERERGVRSNERLRAQREQELIEREYTLGIKMMDRAESVIGLPIVQVTRDQLDEDGLTVHRTIIKPLDRVTLRDAAALMLTADRRIRLALGLYGDPARHPTPEAGVEDTSDVDAWLNELAKEPMKEMPSGD